MKGGGGGGHRATPASGGIDACLPPGGRRLRPGARPAGGSLAAQAEVLAASGRVVCLGDALAWLARPVSDEDGGAEVTVVITFDDGTQDFVDHALPILERHRLPATLYAATAFIEEGQPFESDSHPVSWRALAGIVPPVWSTWDRIPTGTCCSTGCPPSRSTASSTAPSS